MDPHIAAAPTVACASAADRPKRGRPAFDVGVVGEDVVDLVAAATRAQAPDVRPVAVPVLELSFGFAVWLNRLEQHLDLRGCPGHWPQGVSWVGLLGKVKIMSKPYVSVLIDTYNHERFIAQAIKTVLEQDMPMANVEIVVVDDGSTDRTPEIVRGFEPRVRLIRKAN